MVLLYINLDDKSGYQDASMSSSSSSHDDTTKKRTSDVELCGHFASHSASMTHELQGHKCLQ